MIFSFICGLVHPEMCLIAVDELTIKSKCKLPVLNTVLRKNISTIFNVVHV